MRNISPETKLTIIHKAVNRNNQKMSDIALENGVGISTLHKWVKHFREAHGVNSSQGITAASPSVSERFKHVQATFGKDAVKVSAYCREHGIYPHEISQWEAAFMNNADEKKPKQISTELKTLRAENKALKRAIARKDKALAEAAALLVLKKKALEIWGGNEDD